MFLNILEKVAMNKKKYDKRISPFYVTEAQYNFVHEVRENMEVIEQREVKISEALRGLIDDVMGVE